MKIDFDTLSCEEPFAFKERLNQVHTPDRVNPARQQQAGEIAITSDWKIVLPESASDFMRRAAEDLQDYFQVSLHITLEITAQPYCGKGIFLGCGDSALTVSRSFLFDAKEDQIQITGADERGCAMGCYYLEDLLNLREGAFLAPVSQLKKEPLFSPRIIHSSLGISYFTEPYLRKIAHYGFDSVVLYTNREGVIDFAKTIDMAEANGLDVYFYSKIKLTYHPSDPEAEAYYDQEYGGLFERYPKAKGILFVGESAAFPSKDPHVSKPGEKDPNRPVPSCYPCCDYADMIALVQKIVRKRRPDVDIIFWTYNWGLTPGQARIDLINHLPGDVSVSVNFGLHDVVQVGSTQECPLDYSLGVPGPSQLFTEEAQAVSKRSDLRLYTMSNTAGRTWDFGVVPYIPTPYQWMRRLQGMVNSHKKYGLCGLWESHSYGWHPSVVSELAKWMCWSNAPDPEDVLRQIAIRESSETAAEHLMSAWKHWSDGMNGYPMPIEDQYGPARVGPAYPFYFYADMLRTYYDKYSPYPETTQQIIFQWYHPVETVGKTPRAIYRVPAEIDYLVDRIAHWDKGILEYEKVFDSIPEYKKQALIRELTLGCFIRNTLRTTRNIKRWWLRSTGLTMEPDPVKVSAILDDLLEIVKEEEVNVLETLPLVRHNSALGYECAMTYPGDEKHIRRKLDLLKRLMYRDIPDYRQLCGCPEKD